MLLCDVPQSNVIRTFMRDIICFWDDFIFVNSSRQQKWTNLQLIFLVFKNEPGYNFLCNMIEIHTSYLYFPVVLLWCVRKLCCMNMTYEHDMTFFVRIGTMDWDDFCVSWVNYS